VKVSTKVLTLTVGVTALALGVSQLAPAQPGKAVSRQAFMAAFAKQKANAQGVMKTAKVTERALPGGARVKVANVSKDLRFNPVPIAPVGGTVTPMTPTATVLVKIWAAPVVGDKETGQFVNLSLYKWRPKERFYLYFESAVPVHIGLYQDYPNTTNPTRKVLPDTNYPDSFKTIMPGVPYRFPILMEMDNTNEAEFMSIVFVSAGTEPLVINQPPEKPGSGSPPEDPNAVARKYQGAIDSIATKARAKARFAPVQPTTVMTSTSPDDVAVCAFGPENYGFIQLKLFK